MTLELSAYETTVGLTRLTMGDEQQRQGFGDGVVITSRVSASSQQVQFEVLGDVCAQVDKSLCTDRRQHFKCTGKY